MRIAALAAGLSLALLLIASAANSERTQKHNLIVSIKGDISPLELPRLHTAPVNLRIAGRIRTADGAPLPRLQRITLTIAGRGVLDTRGLPVCPRARIAHADNRQAIERCGTAIVGQGSIQAQIFVPRQPSFALDARALAFNGRTAKDGPAIWVHAYAGDPPISIVLPFIVHRRGPSLRTSLTATVPRSLGSLPHLKGFQISFDRRFRYRGKTHSYLSASCPVPASFTAGFLAFAKAS